MSVKKYLKLSAPFIASILTVILFQQLAVETLGLILKYVGGAIAITIIVLYLVVGGYAIVYRGLIKIGSLAWGDVLEKHLYTDKEITKEDVPHKSRIWIAYASSLLQEWISGNPKWVSFDAYYDDMVSPLLEDSDNEVTN